MTSDIKLSKEIIINKCIFYEPHKSIFYKSIFSLFRYDNLLHKLYYYNKNEFNYFLSLDIYKGKNNKNEYVDTLYGNLVYDSVFQNTLKNLNSNTPNSFEDMVINGDRPINLIKTEIEPIMILRECYFFNKNDTSIDLFYLKTLFNFLKYNERINLYGNEKFKFFYLIDILIRFDKTKIKENEKTEIIESVNYLIKNYFSNFINNMYRADLNSFNFTLNLLNLLNNKHLKNDELCNNFQIPNIDFNKIKNNRNIINKYFKIFESNTNENYSSNFKSFFEKNYNIKNSSDIDLRYHSYEKFIFFDFITDSNFSNINLDKSDYEKLLCIKNELEILITKFKDMLKLEIFSINLLTFINYYIKEGYYDIINLCSIVLLDIIEAIIEKLNIKFKINGIKNFKYNTHGNSIEILYCYLRDNYNDSNLVVRYSFYFTSYHFDFRNKVRHGNDVDFNYLNLSQLYKLMVDLNNLYKNDTLIY